MKRRLRTRASGLALILMLGFVPGGVPWGVPWGVSGLSPLATPAFGQALCADPQAACAADLDPRCLRSGGLGAGAVDAGDATPPAVTPGPDCAAALERYRTCLSDAAEQCGGSGPASGECPAFTLRALLDRGYWTGDPEVWAQRFDCVDPGSQFGMAQAVLTALALALAAGVGRLVWGARRLIRRWRGINRIQTWRGDQAAKTPLIGVIADFSGYGFTGRSAWKEAFHDLNTLLSQQSAGLVGEEGFVTVSMPWRIVWPSPGFWSSAERRAALRPERAVRSAQALLRYADADFVIAGRRRQKGVEILIVAREDAAGDARSFLLQPNSEAEERALRQDLAAAIAFFASQALQKDAEADPAERWTSRRRRRYLAAMLPIAERADRAFSDEMKLKLRAGVDRVAGLSLNLDLLSPELLERIATYFERRESDGDAAVAVKFREAIAWRQLAVRKSGDRHMTLQRRALRAMEEAERRSGSASATPEIAGTEIPGTENPGTAIAHYLTEWRISDEWTAEQVRIFVDEGRFESADDWALRASAQWTVSVRGLYADTVERSVDCIRSAIRALDGASRRQKAERLAGLEHTLVGAPYSVVQQVEAELTEARRQVAPIGDAETSAADAIVLAAIRCEAAILAALHLRAESIERLERVRNLGKPAGALTDAFYVAYGNALATELDARPTRDIAERLIGVCADLEAVASEHNRTHLHYYRFAAETGLLSVDLDAARQTPEALARLRDRFEDLRRTIPEGVASHFRGDDETLRNYHNLCVFFWRICAFERQAARYHEARDADAVTQLRAILRSASWRVPTIQLYRRMGRTQEIDDEASEFLLQVQTGVRAVRGALDFSAVTIEELAGDMAIYPPELTAFFAGIGVDLEAERLTEIRRAFDGARDVATAGAGADGAPDGAPDGADRDPGAGGGGPSLPAPGPLPDE